MSRFQEVVKEFIGKNCSGIVRDYLDTSNYHKVNYHILIHVLNVNFYGRKDRELKDYRWSGGINICKICSKYTYPLGSDTPIKLGLHLFKGIHTFPHGEKMCYRCYMNNMKIEYNYAKRYDVNERNIDMGEIIYPPKSFTQVKVQFFPKK